MSLLQHIEDEILELEINELTIIKEIVNKQYIKLMKEWSVIK